MELNGPFYFIKGLRTSPETEFMMAKTFPLSFFVFDELINGFQCYTFFI